jgi:hypothetical protein
MVEATNNKIFIEDFDPEEDPLFITKVLRPYIKDIYSDLKMRGGKDSKGISKSQWLDYTRLPEVVAMRLFALFDTDKDTVLNETEFIDNLIKIFIASIDDKLALTFNIFDTKGQGKINEENAQHIL